MTVPISFIRRTDCIQPRTEVHNPKSQVQELVMALTKCAECGKEISDLAAACPGCGAPVPKSPPARVPLGQRKVGLLPTLMVVGLVGVGFPALLRQINPEDPKAREERYRASTVIELCWEKYKQKSLEPSVKRFVAMTCEKAEADYRAKYNREP